MTAFSNYPRRHGCRSMHTDTVEARQDSYCLSRRFGSEQFDAGMKRPGLEMGSSLISETFLTSQSSARLRTRVKHRPTQQQNVQILPWPNIRLLQAHPQHAKSAERTSSYNFQEEGKPTIFEAPTNDARSQFERSTSTCGAEIPHEVTNAADISYKLEQLFSTGKLKDPAHAEWEQLWYHGVDLTFQKVAHHFPDTKLSTTNIVAGQSISEPTLNVSSLKQEDRALFEKVEKTSKQFFAPNSETERALRQRRAQNATDERERLALLLGLPRYNEYIKSKLQAQKEANGDCLSPSKRQQKRQAKFAEKKQKKEARLSVSVHSIHTAEVQERSDSSAEVKAVNRDFAVKAVKSEGRKNFSARRGMTHENSQAAPKIPIGGAEHRPLVVGLTKPQSTRAASTMASSSEAAALNEEIAKNVKSNTTEAAPSEDNPTAPPTQKAKKEKGPKQPKPQKAAAVAAPTTPALIDLRVGHILRAIAHPNADSLYVSTIAMGDPEGAEHTQVDEETGKVVRTVCSGLNGLVPLEEMQNRKVIVVANLKPVNMRSIKSAAMVLAASPKQPEGADPHAPDRVVELVSPPDSAEAGDKVFFEGWPYGEAKGPEKQLNPKKKQWEAIQPGFYTSDDLTVGFDASQCEEVEGDSKGNLVVEGKGVCTVKTLKGAVVR